LLSRLIDKSLVLTEATSQGQRYRMLETLKEYALARLVETGEQESVQERHRAYFEQLAEESAAKLYGEEQGTWSARLEAEHDNLRAALKCSAQGPVRLRLSASLWRFWMLRGYLSEGRGWLEGALAHPDNAERTPLRAMALYAAGNLAIIQGDLAA